MEEKEALKQLEQLNYDWQTEGLDCKINQTDINAINTIVNELNKNISIVDNIKKYVEWHINNCTDSIEDYMDDDKIGNKDIIDDLKEEREHWRDVVRLMELSEYMYISKEHWGCE
jgi:hypothetical protein